MNDTYQMMMKLAERGLGKSFGREGSEESRSVALILTAIDQLALASQLDPSFFQATQKAIDVLRQHIEGEAKGEKKEKKVTTEGEEEEEEVND